MKKLFILAVGPIVALASIVPVFANGDSVSRQPVIENNGLNFQASYQNGSVTMSWNDFQPTQSNRKYRKVVRSTSKQHPIYPDDGYIKYDGSHSFTSYTDTNPPAGTVYYGICAITESSAGKWRNCDRQAVTVDGGNGGGTVATDSGAGTTTNTTTVTTGLSDSMKVAVEALVEKFKLRLSERFEDDMVGKKAFLSALVPAIDNVINSASDSNKALFQYLREKIVEYQGIVELESLLNVE